mgnify:CR=1 FL=1
MLYILDDFELFVEPFLIQMKGKVPKELVDQTIEACLRLLRIVMGVSSDVAKCIGIFPVHIKL